ncbi:glycosyltransferase family 4 protein [Desertibaculum subflavum]|uniref:glycosyltransferase family 4 protein n=1 Tax=Desertibaculum subflavum TaxID=2268458 RepID=UPI000E6731D5
MRILFIHQNFPGQYKHVAAAFAADKAHQVVAIGRDNAKPLAGVRLERYARPRGAHAGTHPFARRYDDGVQHGELVARLVEKLQREGFVPDVIAAHPGWGEALFLKDVLPQTPLLNYCEFYYRAFGSDAHFDPSETPTAERVMRIRALNAMHLLSLEACDAGMSPTAWQRAQFPAAFHDKIAVVHDGIDTDQVAPNPDARLALPNGRVLTPADEVVTYVARNFEPHRGFLQAMRAIAILCKRRPNAQFVIVGGDEVSYGTQPPDGQTWREVALKEVTLDPNRVSFLGKLAYEHYLKVLQVSSAHIYLTVPFVLSWSMIEALAAGCVVIGSTTPPVLEAVEPGVTGLLADFFQPEAVAAQVERALDDRALAATIRRNARALALARYSLEHCLPIQIGLIERLAGGAAAPPRARRRAAG